MPSITFLPPDEQTPVELFDAPRELACADLIIAVPRTPPSLDITCLPAHLVVRRKDTAVHGATVHGASEFEKIFKHKGSKSTAKVDIDVSGLWPRAPPCSGACFVCLGDDGGMLMNVCDCKWLRVHPNCLESLMLTHQTSRCAVCTKSLQYEPRREKPQEKTDTWPKRSAAALSLLVSSAFTTALGATLLGLAICTASGGVANVPAGFWSFAGPLLMLQGTSTLLMVIGLHLKRPQLCGHSLEHWNGILVLIALWTIVTGTVLIMNLNTSPTTTEPYSGNWTDLTRDLTRRGRSVLGDGSE